MATTIRITLLAGTYGAPAPGGEQTECAPAQLDYPPSPWLLLHTLLKGGEEMLPVAALLAPHCPTYHLPYGQISQPRSSSASTPRQLELGAGAMVYVSWPVSLSAEQERLLNSFLATLPCIGRPADTAVWQVVPAMPSANCVPGVDGGIQLACCDIDLLSMPPQVRQRWVRYRFVPTRQPSSRNGGITAQANRALYAVASGQPLPATAGLAWTDRLHRALLHKAPGSALFAGLLAGRPLPEDQRAWYRWDSCDGTISHLEVLSLQSFDAAELDALSQLQVLYGHSRVRIPLRLLQLDAHSIPAARRISTVTPMLLYTTPRTGKLQRSPGAQAIQSLLWGVGQEGKLPPDSFQQLDEAGPVWIEHPRFGRIQAEVMPRQGPPLIVARGGRRAASSQPFHAQLEAEHPLPLLGLGWGRHFGAGRVTALEAG